MVQVLEKEDLDYKFIVIPAEEGKAKEEVKEVKKKGRFRKHAKQHQELVCVNDLKRKVIGNVPGNRYIIY